jgi:hypothetical protein
MHEDNSMEDFCCLASACVEKKLGKCSVKNSQIQTFEFFLTKYVKKLEVKIRFIVKTFHENIEV